MLLMHILDMAKGGPGIVPRSASGGTYGTDLNNLTTTLNQYSPTDLGNQPFYQKLIGQQANRPFGGFGATLSNPALGLNNVPSNISMQNYNQLLPSEQKATGELYGTGLGVDPADVLAQAKASAPATRNFQTYATAIQSQNYGG